MTKELFQAVLAVSFGGGTRPFRRALFIIGSLAAAMLLVGLYVSSNIPELPLYLPAAWAFAAVASVVFTLAATVLHIAGAAWNRKGSFEKQLVTLPLSNLTTWLAAIIGPTVLSAIVFLFCAPFALTLAKLSQEPPSLFVMAIILGDLAGLAYGAWPCPIRVKPILLVALAGLDVKLLLYALEHGSEVIPVTISSFLVIIIFIGLGSRYRARLGTPPGMISFGKAIRVPNAPLNALWFGLKMTRDRSNLADVAFCGIALLFLAINLRAQSLPAGWEIGWLQMLATAIGAVSGGVRSLIRPAGSAEIFGLGGFRYFCFAQWRGTVFVGLIAGLPALWLIVHNSTWPILGSVCMYILSTTTASSVGLASGSLLAPRKGDLGNQLVATVLAGAGSYLIFAPRFSQTLEILVPFLVFILIISCLISYYAEFHRLRTRGHI